jgi:hypothetical protein
VSDFTPIIQLATALAIAVGFCAQIYLQVKQARRQVEQDRKQDAAVEAVRIQAMKAAVEVKGVKEALGASQITVDENNQQTRESLADLAQVGHSTHVLVNEKMQIQLDINAKLARELSDLLKTPERLAAAEQAEKMSTEHSGKQKILDAKDAGAIVGTFIGKVESKP